MDHVRVRHVSSATGGDVGAFLQAIVGFAVAALVMLGVGGTVYRLVAPGGWLAQVFGRSLAGGLAAVLALLIIGLCAWLARTWISVGSRNRHSDLFVYGFAAAGAFYAIEIFAKGAW
ncbi:MAG TPA: hypothetical protein VET66_10600 [Steroidobacteraceae bacterium]|nr:hypothetical protein [Steroidobacteraceae bacterium]